MSEIPNIETYKETKVGKCCDIISSMLSYSVVWHKCEWWERKRSAKNGCDRWASVTGVSADVTSVTGLSVYAGRNTWLWDIHPEECKYGRFLDALGKSCWKLLLCTPMFLPACFYLLPNIDYRASRQGHSYVEKCD